MLVAQCTVFDQDNVFCPDLFQEREQVLAGVPDLDLLAVLPQFLGRLLDCLTDPWMEVRTQATKVLRVGPLITQAHLVPTHHSSASAICSEPRHDEVKSLIRLAYREARVARVQGCRVIGPSCLSSRAWLSASPPKTCMGWMQIHTDSLDPQDLLVDIQASQHVDYAALTRILAGAARRGEAAQRLTALRWLCAFLADARRDLLPQYPELVAVVLPALAHPDAAIRDVSRTGWARTAAPLVSALPAHLLCMLLLIHGNLDSCSILLLRASSEFRGE